MRKREREAAGRGLLPWLVILGIPGAWKGNPRQCISSGNALAKCTGDAMPVHFLRPPSMLARDQSACKAALTSLLVYAHSNPPINLFIHLPANLIIYAPTYLPLETTTLANRG